MKNFIKNISLPHSLLFRLFIIILLSLTVINSFILAVEIDRINSYKKVISHQIIGYQFAGLEKFLKGVKYTGYFTDTDLKKDESQKFFSQAQYIVAPTILVPFDVNLEYMIFYCKNEKTSLTIMQKLGYSPLQRNKYGVILAKK